MKIRIKVIAGSSKESIEWFGELLKVKVRAQPEKGRANAAVERVLAERLGLATDAVYVVTGFTKTLKTVELTGMDMEELRNKIR
jgi:uncharacterized protein YggU (UPF0235/DUF167 family)